GEHPPARRLLDSDRRCLRGATRGAPPAPFRRRDRCGPQNRPCERRLTSEGNRPIQSTNREKKMSDKTKDNGKLLKRPLRRREVIKGGIAAAALVAGSSVFAPRIVRGAGGSITIGSFQDNAMAPFRDYFLKQFTNETGIQATYNETNYDSWYQTCKNDGLNKT